MSWCACNVTQLSCLHLCVRRCAYICIYLYLYVYICLYVFMCLCTCVCMCVCLCVFATMYWWNKKMNKRIVLVATRACDDQCVHLSADRWNGTIDCRPAVLQQLQSTITSQTHSADAMHWSRIWWRRAHSHSLHTLYHAIRRQSLVVDARISAFNYWTHATERPRRTANVTLKLSNVRDQSQIQVVNYSMAKNKTDYSRNFTDSRKK